MAPGFADLPAEVEAEVMLLKQALASDDLDRNSGPKMTTCVIFFCGEDRITALPKKRRHSREKYKGDSELPLKET